MENKYNRLIFIYGYYVVLMIKNNCLKQENFEEAALIDQALQYHEKTYSVELPRFATEDALKDYQADIWRKGYSGEIALNNLEEYYNNALAELSAQ